MCSFDFNIRINLKGMSGKYFSDENATEEIEGNDAGPGDSFCMPTVVLLLLISGVILRRTVQKNIATN